MNKDLMLMEALEARAKRREERREFIRAAGGATVALAGVSMLGACSGVSDGNDDQTSTPAPTPTPTPVVLTDGDILNFALNLEYLEAQFYSFAVSGTGLPDSLLGGTGTKGNATGGRQVNFTDPQVAAYAREIAQDERAHVAFLRQAIGATSVAQPPIDIGTDPNGAFSSAARAAGLVGAGQSFDPYANDENFLLGAFIFEDVGVTAYKGSARLISSKAFLEAAAGILAAEAYHASLIRATLYVKGIAAPSLQLIEATEKISDARDELDGTPDIDQGIAPIGNASNIVPADGNGIAFSRTAGQVLNITYLNRQAVVSGGFFPAGVNGAIKASAAS